MHHKKDPHKSQTAVASGYYDAIYLYGQAVYQSKNPKNNSEILEQMKSTVITVEKGGNAERIVMDENGDQKIEFSMHCLTGGGMNQNWRRV